MGDVESGWQENGKENKAYSVVHIVFNITCLLRTHLNSVIFFPLPFPLSFSLLIFDFETMLFVSSQPTLLLSIYALTNTFSFLWLHATSEMSAASSNPPHKSIRKACPFAKSINKLSQFLHCYPFWKWRWCQRRKHGYRSHGTKFQTLAESREIEICLHGIRHMRKQCIYISLLFHGILPYQENHCLQETYTKLRISWHISK